MVLWSAPLKAAAALTVGSKLGKLGLNDQSSLAVGAGSGSDRRSLFVSNRLFESNFIDIQATALRLLDRQATALRLLDRPRAFTLVYVLYWSSGVCIGGVHAQAMGSRRASPAALF